MANNDIEAIPNRLRKKSTHFVNVLLMGLAFMVFVVVGLTVSLSISACRHHDRHSKDLPYHNETYSESANEEQEGASVSESHCVVPDSVIRFCMPSTMEGLSEQIIRKCSYVVSYNKETMMPNWVAWQLTGEHTDGPYGRLSNFYEEEDVPSPRATLEDYRGSGWSRGHMCPAGDNKWDEKAMYDSFSLVNVCPQNASLNSGLWNSIEISCRKWAKTYGSLYIVCGPIFFKSQEHERIGVNQIPVPEAFFKVILCVGSSTPKGIGFICRNTDGNRKKDFYVNSIRQVERVTGYSFFPNLSDSIRNIVYDMDDISIW